MYWNVQTCYKFGKFGILNEDISDHFPLFDNETTLSRINISKINISIFRKSLMKTYVCLVVHRLASLYCTICFQKSMTCSFLLSNMGWTTINEHIKNPLIKNILFKISKLNPSVQNIKNYKAHTNSLIYLLRNAERKHFERVEFK